MADISNGPVSTLSKEKMTRAQCEKMLSRAKEVGKSFGDKVTVDNFRCVKR